MADWSVTLEEIRARHALPALGAVVIRRGVEVAASVVGKRSVSHEQEATIDDAWHIGSCTKSMTATLLMRTVEDGLLSLDDTLQELFSSECNNASLTPIVVHETWRDTTLASVLHHTAGMPASAKEFAPALWRALWDKSSHSVVGARDEWVRHVLTRPVPHPSGQYQYSNSGYIVAGAILERMHSREAGKLVTCEELFKTLLFEPLGMTSAGFGCPKPPRSFGIDTANGASASSGGILSTIRNALFAGQPGEAQCVFGHRANGESVPPSPHADNPLCIGPAGGVHATLRDMAAYVDMHTRRVCGPVLRQRSSFDALHSVSEASGKYTLGWIRVERSWAHGEAFTHAGSNTMNKCVVWFAPAVELTVVIATNTGAPGNDSACDAVAGAAIRRALSA